MIKNSSKYQIATAIAVLFHCIGLAGILLFHSDLFARCTPVNLLLSFSLLVWTQEGKNKAFFVFMASVIIAGFFAEVAGVHTGLLFGDYNYGDVLGPQWLQVPLVIGINWFIVIYCCGMATQALLLKVIRKLAPESGEPVLLLKGLSVIADGASMAVLFDWLIEPVAVRLGFWAWLAPGGIPLYNYLCWFVVSILLLAVFHFCRFHKQNIFAIHLLLIQALFFLILRTFFTGA